MPEFSNQNHLNPLHIPTSSYSEVHGGHPSRTRSWGSQLTVVVLSWLRFTARIALLH